MIGAWVYGACGLRFAMPYDERARRKYKLIRSQKF